MHFESVHNSQQDNPIYTLWLFQTAKQQFDYKTTVFDYKKKPLDSKNIQHLLDGHTWDICILSPSTIHSKTIPSTLFDPFRQQNNSFQLQNNSFRLQEKNL